MRSIVPVDDTKILMMNQLHLHVRIFEVSLRVVHPTSLDDVLICKLCMFSYLVQSCFEARCSVERVGTNEQTGARGVVH